MRVSSVLPFVLSACASAAPPSEVARATDPVSAPAEIRGRYLFSLEESDPARPLREGCVAKSPANAEACYAQIAAVAAKEGLSFDKDERGQTIFASFGEENGAPQVYHTAPVALTPDGPDALLSKSLANATGTLATTRPMPAGTVVRIELADVSGRVADTIAVVDPKKGRLVFHRAHEGR